MRKVLYILALAIMFAAPAQAMQTYAHSNFVTPPDSDTINDVALTANTAATINWPAGSAYVNVACSAAYWTSLQSGISVPASTITTGLGAALNTAQRQRGAGENTFYIISATSQECSLEFWGL